jgi:hypothetical protein
MNRFAALLFTVPALGLSGCLLDISLPGERSVEVTETPDEWTTNPYGTYGPVVLVSPHIRADFGDVDEVDAAAFAAEGYESGGYTTITIRGRNATGVVMTQLEVSGGDLATANTDVDPSIYASAIGCSGPEDNVWTTDVSVDTIDIRSTPNPENPAYVQVSVSADFGVNGKIDTTFEYAPSGSLSNR